MPATHAGQSYAIRRKKLFRLDFRHGRVGQRLLHSVVKELLKMPKHLDIPGRCVAVSHHQPGIADRVRLVGLGEIERETHAIRKSNLSQNSGLSRQSLS